MLSLDGIYSAINGLFDSIRPPQKHIDRLMLVCSMRKRPGLSVLRSVANVTKTLNMLGIPTDKMPDGSTNKTLEVVYGIINEVFRALRFDARVQVGSMPGARSIGFGANAGGAFTVVSNTIGSIEGEGVIG